MATKSNELHLTRLYDAPMELVWEAWADPKKTANWWGPRGFTITTLSKDLRPGGTWDYIMHGPDGVDYHNVTDYLEVIEGKRLVYDHGGNRDENRAPLFRVTVTFEEAEGKTKMEMTMAFPSPEVAIEMKKFIKQAGGNGTWDRLGEYLEEVANNKDIFLINRSFDCDINTMFDLWTMPEHFSKWLPPTGMTMQFLKAEIKVGSETFYKMTDGKEMTMYGKTKYLEISRPDLIKYIQLFSNEQGGPGKHPLAPTWPEQMLVSVQLTEEGPKQTRVTVRWEVYGEATAAERETFHDAKPGMTQGWSGSFDKLEDLLLQK